MTSRDGNVLVLTLDRGENRLTPDSLAAWSQALDEVETDPSITALVTTGDGKFYSNGLDVEVLGSPDAGPYLDRVCDLLARLLVAPVVTVAAVNGHAFGAGAMLALAHDASVLRADRGYVCLPEVDLGLPFLPLMSALVRTKLAPRTAQEAMTFGLRYDGARALAAAVVTATAEQQQVLPTALALAHERGGKDRGALATIKADLYAAVLQHRP